MAVRFLTEEDRTHWIEIRKGDELLPETTLTSADETPGEFVIDEFPPALAVDKIYIVNWNDTEYAVTAIDGTDIVGSTAVLLTNKETNLETYEGMKFAIAHLLNSNTYELRDGSGATSVILTIHQAEEIIHKLPDEFLSESAATKAYVENYVKEQLGVIENGYY